MRCCRSRTQQVVQKLYNWFSFAILTYILILHDFLNIFKTDFQTKVNPKFNNLYPSYPDHDPDLIDLSENSNTFSPDFYIITATYKRWTQKADLTRLAHSFILNKAKIHWILIEDTKQSQPNLMLVKFKKDWENYSKNFYLCQGCLKIDLLTASTPDNFKLQKEDPNWLFPRGANQRNAGLEFLYEKFNSNKSLKLNENALLYFADDDNTYDSNLFKNFIKLKTLYGSSEKSIGLVPTGISGGLKWEGPVCDSTNNGAIINFHTAWRPERPFPIDMASFILKLSQALKTEPKFSSKTRRGYLESDFLINYLNIEQYKNKFAWDKDAAAMYLSGQPFFAPSEELNREIYRKFVVGLNCREILVWHTQTVKPKDRDELKLIAEGRGSVELEY